MTKLTQMILTPVNMTKVKNAKFSLNFWPLTLRLASVGMAQYMRNLKQSRGSSLIVQ